MKAILNPLLVNLTSLFLMACVGGGATDSPLLQVEGGWIRAMPLSGEGGQLGVNSAAYLRIRNDGGVADQLTSADSDVAGSVEIHETRMDGDLMRMAELESLEIPPSTTVELKPGGFHLMLRGLTRPLVEGDEIELNLHFRTSGDVSVVFPVSAAPPS